MLQKLQGGTTLIVDRYAFSGVAYTHAKVCLRKFSCQSKTVCLHGLDLDWCRAPDVGLPAPDLILYMYGDAAMLRSRAEYGDERYEEDAFQCKVRNAYNALRASEKDRWQVGKKLSSSTVTWRNSKDINATDDFDTVAEKLFDAARRAIDNACGEVGKLWV